MQNLPFVVSQNLAAQNTSLKGAVVAQNTQKSVDSGSSFKQVLSKKVESEASKKGETQQIKAPQEKSQQNHERAHAASKVANKQVTSEKAEVAATSEIENDDAETMALPANSADLLATLPAEDRQQIDAGENAVKTTSSQDALAITGIPLPPVDTWFVKTQDASDELDSQKRLQLDAGLKAALDQTTKTAAKEEKHINPVEDSASDNLLLKDDVSAKNNKWLESVLPRMSKSADGGESLAGKFVNKLMPMSHAQLQQESPTKFKKESLTALTAITAPSAVMHAVAMMDVAQIQAGTSNVINAYPGKTGWDQAISQKVVWMVGAKEQTATLTLNPPDLGPLQVVINVNNDKADATFISENPEVRKILQDGISTLRGLMDQAGVQLGQANVSTGKQQQDFQQAAKERSHQHVSENISAQPVETPVIMRNISRANNGLVDTFA